MCVRRVGSNLPPLTPTVGWAADIKQQRLHLANTATELRSTFSKIGLTELTRAASGTWAKESFEIPTYITYQDGAPRGTPNGRRKNCHEVGGSGGASRGLHAVAETDSGSKDNASRLSFSLSAQHDDRWRQVI